MFSFFEKIQFSGWNHSQRFTLKIYNFILCKNNQRKTLIYLLCREEKKLNLSWTVKRYNFSEFSQKEKIVHKLNTFQEEKVQNTNQTELKFKIIWKCFNFNSIFVDVFFSLLINTKYIHFTVNRWIRDNLLVGKKIQKFDKNENNFDEHPYDWYKKGNFIERKKV